jgi:AraC family transcriptional regulator
MSLQKPLAIDLRLQEEMLTVIPRSPLLSSYGLDFKGFKLAYYSQPSWETPEFVTSHHIVSLQTKNAGRVEVLSESRLQGFENIEKMVKVYPSDTPFSVNWSREIEFLHCYIDSRFLNQVAYEAVGRDRIELSLTLSESDTLSREILLALKASLEWGISSNRFYVESMVTALSAQLIRNYSIYPQTLRNYQDGLSNYRLKQTIAYINDHLSQNISLEELAQELSMSKYYFCKLFKQSIGLSPYQYLIQQRVERAKELLHRDKLNIAEVALAVGFCDQSSLSKHLKRLTGLTPKQLQNRKRSQESPPFNKN